MSGRPPLPPGFRLVLHPRARVLGGRVVVGGEPRRALRLTDRGAASLDRLRRGEPVRDVVDGTLARRLVDAGLASARPAPEAGVSVTVVIPVHDGSDEVDGCLRGLGDRESVVVVDDASRDMVSVGRVARAHGARVVRRDTNGGPAAARDSGAAATTSDVVAFVDSDARIGPAGLRALLAHFADPCVGAVAPRVVPAADARGVLARFAAARSPLDMRDEPGEVRRGRLSYVPSTVLLVRRKALDEVGGWEEALRYGEDVDLVWRLTDAGWSVRYDPAVRAEHHEPRTWQGWLRRRHRYGTSAGALSIRHPDRLRGPSLRGFVAPLSVLRAAPRLRDAEVPARDVLMPAAAAPARTALGLLQWGTPLWWPVLVAAATRRRTRSVAVIALLAPAVVEWRQRRPALDPARYVAAALADEVAYGSGVWRGCARARTWRPLLPRLR